MPTDNGRYRVVVNDEEQYSVWPVRKANALGWHAAGYEGTRAECLAHIDRVWTDLRPRSLRAQLAAAEAEEPTCPTH